MESSVLLFSSWMRASRPLLGELAEKENSLIARSALNNDPHLAAQRRRPHPFRVRANNK
jgi:hypothetical protein